jgi:hypothetical protein
VQAHTHTVQPAHLAIGSVFNENFFFKQSPGDDGYVTLEISRVNFEFYTNNQEAGLKPANPMCIS